MKEPQQFAGVTTICLAAGFFLLSGVTMLIPLVHAADEPSVEAAEVSAPDATLEHMRAEIATEDDPELRAAMEEQLDLLESGQLDFQTLEREMAQTTREGGSNYGINPATGGWEPGMGGAVYGGGPMPGMSRGGDPMANVARAGYDTGAAKELAAKLGVDANLNLNDPSVMEQLVREGKLTTNDLSKALGELGAEGRMDTRLGEMSRTFYGATEHMGGRAYGQVDTSTASLVEAMTKSGAISEARARELMVPMGNVFDPNSSEWQALSPEEKASAASLSQRAAEALAYEQAGGDKSHWQSGFEGGNYGINPATGGWEPGMGGGTTGGNYLPPEARAELEKIFSQGTGDPSKDGHLREQAEKVFEKYGIDHDRSGMMGYDRDESGARVGYYEGRQGEMTPPREAFQQWEQSEQGQRADPATREQYREMSEKYQAEFEQRGGFERGGEFGERAMEQMSPEARDRMGREMGGMREGMGREMAGPSDRAAERMSHEGRERMGREFGGPMDREMRGPMDREMRGPMGREMAGPSDRAAERMSHDEAREQMGREFGGPMDREMRGPMDREMRGPMDREMRGPMDREMMEHMTPEAREHMERSRNEHEMSREAREMERGGMGREMMERERGMGMEREMSGREMYRESMEREVQGMSPEAREQMEREFGGPSRETMEREFGGPSPERSYEAPTREYETQAREHEAQTREYESMTREYEAPTVERSYEAPMREYEAPTYEAPTHEYEAPTYEYERPTYEYQSGEMPH